MKNRVQLLQIALAAFGVFAGQRGIQQGPNGFVAQDTTMYLTADLKNKGGAIQLVDANTKKVEGITNFDGNRLAKGRHLIIDGVRLLLETTADATLAAATFKSDAPAAVKASHLVITQGEQILNIPVSDIFNDNSATGNGDDYREISHLPIIEADKEFKVEWVFPNSGGHGNTTCWARLEFRTTEVFVK